MTLNIYDVSSLLADDCGDAGIIPKKTTLRHKHVGREAFAERPFGAGRVVCTSTAHL